MKDDPISLCKEIREEIDKLRKSVRELKADMEELVECTAEKEEEEEEGEASTGPCGFGEDIEIV